MGRGRERSLGLVDCRPLGGGKALWIHGGRLPAHVTGVTFEPPHTEGDATSAEGAGAREQRATRVMRLRWCQAHDLMTRAVTRRG